MFSLRPPAAAPGQASSSRFAIGGGRDSYDMLPYLCRSIPQTHPGNLAIAAVLRGIEPVPIDRCRVLELGCGNGGNLIPLAATWPGSHFVGVDRSSVQINQGQEFLSPFDLSNIDLRASDLLDFTAEPGSFDYILCHGVYSWVPAPVRQRILELCQRLLSPRGIAYISYNTYPGFYRRQHIMDMMRYHIRGLGITDPAETVKQARQLLSFLVASSPEPDGTTARLLREEAARLAQVPDSYIFHEHFEAENQPFYFYEFMEEAGRHGLQYLDEAVPKVGTAGLPEGTQSVLSQIADDVVRHEQYLDFIRNTSLRSTLLCHRGVVLRDGPNPEVLQGLKILSAAAPEKPNELSMNKLRDESPVRFLSRVGAATMDHPQFKVMLWALFDQRPCAMSLPDLTARVTEIMGSPVTQDDVLEMAVYGHRTGIVGLHTQSPSVVNRVSERPCASLIARRQVLLDTAVTTQWHLSVNVDPLRRVLLPLLDGTRDHGELLAGLLLAIEKGQLVVEGPGGNRGPLAASDPQLIEQLRTQHMPRALTACADLGLLIS